MARLVSVRPTLRMHTVIAGPYGGAPVVLLHGYPEFWWSWRHQLRFLDEGGWRAIAPDLRGVNYSDKPATGYDPPTLAGDLLGLLDALDLTQAVFVGNDYGGVLAYILALLHPQRVRALVVLNTMHPARWPSSRLSGRNPMRIIAFMTLLGHAIGGPLLHVANQSLGIGGGMGWLAHQKNALPHNVRVAYSQAYARSGRTATAYAPALARWLRDDMPEDLTITHPTLVLWPEKDRSAPVWLTHGIHETIPRAQVVIIPQAGHWVQQEQPAAVNAALTAFLRDLP
ncbi:MAG: alpha/beta fold hydrolase [Anaerolineales bacterium]